MNRRHTYSIWHLSASLSSLHPPAPPPFIQLFGKIYHDTRGLKTLGSRPTLRRTWNFSRGMLLFVRHEANAANWKNRFKYHYTPLLHVEASQLYKKARKTRPLLVPTSGKRIVRKSMLINKHRGCSVTENRRSTFVIKRFRKKRTSSYRHNIIIMAKNVSFQYKGKKIINETFRYTHW